MGQRERGIGNLAFISVLVLLVVAIALFFVANSEADRQRSIAKTNSANAAKAQNALVEAQNAYDALLDVTGLTLAELRRSPASDSPDDANTFPPADKVRESVRKWVSEQAEQIAADSEITLTTQNFQVPQGGAQIVATEGDKTRLRFFQVTEGPETVTMRSVYDVLSAAFKLAGKVAVENNDKYETTATSMRQEVDALKKGLEAARTQYANDVTAKTSQADSLQGELSNTRDSLQAQTAKLDAMESELATVKSDSAREIRVKERERAAWQNRAMNEKVKVELGLKENPKDGEVLEASQTRSTVWINLGRKHKVTNGTRFTVWAPGKGNFREEIAVIRVINVGDTSSEASIVKRIDARRHPTKGMNVSNPFYNPQGELIVHIYGNLSKYTTDLAERRLAATGVRIAKILDDTVNVIVLGEPPVGGEVVEEEDPAAAERKRTIERDKRLNEVMARAASIGAVVVTEEVLATFIDY
jgi:hypothetical protein